MTMYRILINDQEINPQPTGYFNADLVRTELSYAKTVAAFVSAANPTQTVVVVDEDNKVVETFFNGF
ncbi:hypothetical protein [Microbispora sp. NPDC049125]|uniref:hypothetical protein n=1 Tax=Microbispora sp. NPDC049125 TaxID=3154929 RepID=UPI0034676E21